jgi:hypothetical protein
MFRKNTAGQFIHFQGVDATTGGIKSGVTWTIRRCIDGTFAAGGGTATEDGTTGWYKYAMVQADTNGNNIGFNFTGTGAVPQTVNIITTACDPTTATNFGITALPAVASGSAGAVLIDGTGTAAISNSSGKVLLQATQSGVTIPTVTTVTNQLTAAAIATGIWQDATAGDFTAALSVGKSVMNGVALGTGLTINAYTGDTPQTGDSYALANGANGFVAIKADTAAILVDTGTTLDARIPAALVGGRMDSSLGAIAVGVDLTAAMKTSVTTAATAATPTVTAGTVSDKTGYALSSSGITAIWAEVMATGVTAVQAMRGFIAALLGKASGLDTNTPTYRDVADSKDVITAATDSNGNRTAVTLDLT